MFLMSLLFFFSPRFLSLLFQQLCKRREAYIKRQRISREKISFPFFLGPRSKLGGGDTMNMRHKKIEKRERNEISYGAKNERWLVIISLYISSASWQASWVSSSLKQQKQQQHVWCAAKTNLLFSKPAALGPSACLSVCLSIRPFGRGA